MIYIVFREHTVFVGQTCKNNFNFATKYIGVGRTFIYVSVYLFSQTSLYKIVFVHAPSGTSLSCHLNDN